MRQLLLTLSFLTFTIVSFAQFSDTATLNAYIRDTIKDRRPNKVTAAQLQKGMLGITQFLNPNDKTFANTDLTFTANRRHDLNGKSLTITDLSTPNVSSFIMNYTGMFYASNNADNDRATSFSMYSTHKPIELRARMISNSDRNMTFSVDTNYVNIKGKAGLEIVRFMDRNVLFGDTVTITTMSNSDSSNRAASTAFVKRVATAGGGAAPGANRQIIFKDGTVLNGDEKFLFNNTTGKLTVINKLELGSTNTFNNVLTGGSLAVGDHNIFSAESFNSLAIGDGNNFTGQHQFAVGQNNQMFGASIFAVGDNNAVTGSSAMAVGQSNTIVNGIAAAVGNNLKSRFTNQLLIGQFNDTTVNRSFAIGGGSANNNRLNVFSVDPSGQVMSRTVADGTSSDAVVVWNETDMLFKKVPQASLAQNFANTDLTFTGSRTHILGSNSLTIVGNNGVQFGAFGLSSSGFNFQANSTTTKTIKDFTTSAAIMHLGVLSSVTGGQKGEIIIDTFRVTINKLQLNGNEGTATGLWGRDGSGLFSSITIGSGLSLTGNTLTATGGSSGVSSFNSRTGAVSPATNDYTWAQINKSTSSLADITTRLFSDLQSKPTTLSGYGITDPVVLTSGSYSNPSWITGLAWSKITGTPTTFAGYGLTQPVTSFSAGDLSPLFTTAEATATTTPALSFTLSNAAAYTLFGNKTGSAAAPGYMTVSELAAIMPEQDLIVGGSIANTTASDGSDSIALSGDLVSPGNNKLYGTNGSGAKGWYDQPTGTGSGDVTSSVSSSLNQQIALYNGTGGKTITPATNNGFVYTTNGVIGWALSTGSGNIVLATSPTIVTPTIASFTNAQHNHTNAAGGGQLAEGALALTDITTNNATTGRHGLMPKLSGASGQYIDGATGAWTNLPASGSGTVTNFSAGDLSPLFTTSESTTTTTPALSFSLSNAAGYTLFGNKNGTTGAPGYMTVSELSAIMPEQDLSVGGSIKTRLAADGVTDSIHLDGDVVAPGNSKLYGTSASGVKGWYDQPAGGGGGGAVSSVFGRTGAVVAATNDYTWAQIDKSTSSLADISTRLFSDLQSKPTTISGYGITDALSLTGTQTLTNKTLTTPTIAQINGGAAANDDLTLQGTTNATRTTSYVSLQPNGGKVGIGTATPTYTFDVVKNDGTFDMVGTFTDLYNNGFVMFGLKGTGNEWNFGKGNAGTTFQNLANDFFVFNQTAATTPFVISSTDFVGINNTDPTSRLTVAENKTANTTTNLITADISNSGTYNATSAARTAYVARFVSTASRSAGSNAVTGVGGYFSSSGAQNNYAAIFDAGNVGIGTTTPSSKLHVSGSVRLDLGSDATNDMFYRTSGGSLGRIAAGSNGQILQSVSGVPTFMNKDYSSGSYTPTVTIDDNVNSISSVNGFRYILIGSIVHVSGVIIANPTTPGTQSAVYIDLPVAADLQNGYDVTGLAVLNTSPNPKSGIISGDASTNKAYLSWQSNSTTDYIHVSFDYYLNPL